MISEKTAQESRIVARMRKMVAAKKRRKHLLWRADKLRAQGQIEQANALVCRARDIEVVPR